MAGYDAGTVYTFLNLGKGKVTPVDALKSYEGIKA